jgi:proteasome lid subunit RPN8/RPN11
VEAGAPGETRRELTALYLSAAKARAIEASARAARPHEYCGALLGCYTDSTATITHIVRLHNSDTRPGRFSIADAEIRYARLLASELRRDVVAVLHTHASSPPIPSEHDRSAIAHSSYQWVIAGFDRQDCFQIAAFLAHSLAPLPVRRAQEAAYDISGSS